MANQAFVTQPVIKIRDAKGNVTDSTATVTISIEEGSGSLAGTLTKNAVNGVATFDDLKIDSVGNFKIKASALSFSAISATFSVSAGSVDHLAFITQPASSLAGETFTAAVQFQDADNNPISTSDSVTIAIVGSADLNGTLNVNASNGTATFSDLDIRKVGSFNLKATSGASLEVTSSTFNISPAAAAKLVVVQEPSANATAGAAFSTQPKIEIRDTYNNLRSTDVLSITAAIHTGSGTLLGNTTVSASSGVAQFANLQFNVAGDKKLKFTSGSLTEAVSGTLTIGPAAANKLVFATEPDGAVSGAALGTQPVVQIRDLYDNVITSSTEMVSMSVTGGPSSELKGTLDVNANAGVATFSDLRIDAAGSNYKLYATAPSIAPATSASFNVAPGAPKKFVFNMNPYGGVAGQALSNQPRLEIHDGQDNQTDANISITVAIHTGSGTLQGTKTKSASNGTVQFTDLRIDKAEEGYQLSFSGSGMTDAVSEPFDVVPSTPSKLKFVQQPSGAIVNQPFSTQPSIEVLDAYDNRVKNDSDPITLTVESGQGTLSGTAVKNLTEGLVTFSGLALDIVNEGVSLKASGLSLEVVSATFNVSAGPPAKLAFVQQPGGAQAGADFTQQPKVELRDADNNAVTTAGVAITIAKKSGSGELQGDTTVLTNSSGVAEFLDLQIDVAGDYTLEPSSSGITTVQTSDTFTVNPGDAAKLVFTTSPSGAKSGAAFSVQPVVEVQDSYGNKVSVAMLIGLEIEEGTGELKGANTNVNSTAGVAEFSGLYINELDTFKLKATSGSLSGTSGSFTVAAGEYHHLTFTSSSSLTAGSCHDLVIEARDVNNNVTNLTADLEVNLGADDYRQGFFATSCGASDAGTSTKNYTIVQGQSSVTAKFIDDNAGSFKFLAMVSSTLAGEQSVTLVAGAPHHLVLAASTTTPLVATCVEIAADVYDNFGNHRTAGQLLAVAITGKGNGLLYSDNTCSTQVTGNWAFPAASITEKIYFKNNKVEENTLTFNDSVNLSESASVGPISWSSSATKLVLTGDEDIAVDTCEEYVMSREDNLGNQIPVAGTTNFTISASGFGFLYTNASCSTSPTASITGTVSSGATYTFWYKSSTATTATMTATQSGGSLSSGTLEVDVSVLGGTFTSIEISGQNTISILTEPPCQAYTVTLRDQVGNAYTTPVDIPLTLSSSSLLTYLGTSASCATGGTGLGVRDIIPLPLEGGSPKVAAGQSTSTFYVRHPVSDTISLTAEGGGKSGTLSNILVLDARSGSTIVAFNIPAAPTSIPVGVCTPIYIYLKDKDGTAVNAEGGETFTPSFYRTSDGTVLDVAVYEDSTCYTAVSGTFEFAANSPSRTVYVRSEVSGGFEFYVWHPNNLLAPAYFSGTFTGGVLDVSFSGDGILNFSADQSTLGKYSFMRSDPTQARSAAGQTFRSVFAGQSDSGSFKAKIYDVSGAILKDIDTDLGVPGSTWTVQAISQTHYANSSIILAGSGELGTTAKYMGFEIYDVGTYTALNTAKSVVFWGANDVAVYGVAAKRSGATDLITLVGSVDGKQQMLRVDHSGFPVAGFGSGGIAELGNGAVRAITYDGAADKTYIARHYGNDYYIDRLDDDGDVTELVASLPAASLLCTGSLTPHSLSVQRTSANKNFLWTAFECTIGGYFANAVFLVIDLDLGQLVDFSGSSFLKIYKPSLEPTASNIQLSSLHEAGDSMLLGFTSTKLSGKGVGVARITSAGALDSSFGTNGVFLDYFTSTYTQADVTHLGFGLDGSDKIVFGARANVTLPAVATESIIGRLLP